MVNSFPSILMQETFNEKSKEFYTALQAVDKKDICADNIGYLMRIYAATKQLYIRNTILKLLYDASFLELKAFFEHAYKKERYLDMKLHALRGLSQFISEKEIEKLLVKFNESLLKRAQSTPYNYQEYELLRGKNALPYLVETYHYECFKNTLAQVNRQYDAMPEAFKGHFTTNENGDFVSLRSPGEVKAIIERFYEEAKKR